MKSNIKIIIVFLLLIGMQEAFALGVSPATEVINFKPGLEHEFVLRVLNSQNRSMRVEISKEGGLSEYVDLSDDMIEFSSDEKQKSFTVKVSLPDSVGEAGDHIVKILITEVPKATKRADIGIATRVAVASQLRIRVPYLGKYAEAELSMAASDGNVNIYIPISNIGTEDIVARAKIKIFDGDKELDVIETNSLDIKSLEKGWINEEWNVTSIGSYKVFAEVYYGDKVIWLDGKVDVGEKFIEVEEVLFDKVKLGDVAGFDIVAKSGWNDVIKNVYADVFVEDKEGEIVAELKTASSDIGAFSEEKLRAYWDTEGISEGAYDFVVRINYEGKIAEKIVEVNVEKGEIGVARVKEVKPSPVADWVIVGAVLVIIVLVIVIFVLLRRRKDYGNFD